MPKSLLRRCQPDSIREFRAAARQRYDDGLALLSSGRRTGAIYVWGYTCEMLLKAAYFSSRGLAPTAPLSWSQHLRPAIDRGRQVFQIAWSRSGAGHNVRAWAELLIAERNTSSARAFPIPFALEVQKHGQEIEAFWQETLRYHKNTAYFYEVKRVQRSTEWFLVHQDLL